MSRNHLLPAAIVFPGLLALGSVSCSKEKEKEKEMGSVEPRGSERHRTAQPTKERLTELGNGKFGIVEGEVTSQGSTGPVKLKRNKGPALNLSADRIEKKPDGSMFLPSPVEVSTPAGYKAIIENGGVLLKQDGTMETQGTRKELAAPPTPELPLPVKPSPQKTEQNPDVSGQ